MGRPSRHYDVMSCYDKWVPAYVFWPFFKSPLSFGSLELFRSPRMWSPSLETFVSAVINRNGDFSNYRK